MSKLDDHTDLDAAIAKLDQLAWIGDHAAEIALPAISAVARAQWAAGQYPGGGKWALTKKDSRVALTALTAKITIEAKGKTLTMHGPELLDAHIRTRRSMPEKGFGLPGPWRRAADKALKERIDALGR